MVAPYVRERARNVLQSRHFHFVRLVALVFREGHQPPNRRVERREDVLRSVNDGVACLDQVSLASEVGDRMTQHGLDALRGGPQLPTFFLELEIVRKCKFRRGGHVILTLFRFLFRFRFRPGAFPFLLRLLRLLRRLLDVVQGPWIPIRFLFLGAPLLLPPLRLLPPIAASIRFSHHRYEIIIFNARPFRLVGNELQCSHVPELFNDVVQLHELCFAVHDKVDRETSTEITLLSILPAETLVGAGRMKERLALLRRHPFERLHQRRPQPGILGAPFARL
mmetsp:Transcript_109595/g.318375  ORF Transcript_109595/g.318375 Transcript_109595/m.318375 type:complete len:279 (+) Transcript_109595:933-1769(+)